MAGETIQCTEACTVTIQLQPAPPDPSHIADYSTMFGLFFLAALVIFCARKVYDFFDRTPHHEGS